MPTYEYRCPLGHEFEVVQRITGRRPRTKCPTCGRIAERQLSGGAGLIFKGSGFYITDYGKDGKGPRKEPEGEIKKPDAVPAAAKDAPAAPSTPAPAADTDKPAKKKAKPRE